MHNKCKNAKGLRPFKKSEPKNLRHKHTTSAKTPRGFDLSKGPNQKTFGTSTQQVQKHEGDSTFQSIRTKKGTISIKRRPTGCLGKIEKWMPERGMGRFFPQEPSAPIIWFTQNQRNKDPRGQQRERKGGDIFSPKKKFPRIASSANKSYIETTNTPAKNTSGQRLIRKGETFFFQESP